VRSREKVMQQYQHYATTEIYVKEVQQILEGAEKAVMHV